LSLIVDGELFLRSEELPPFVEVKSATRRFLLCKSAFVVDVESALLTSCAETLVLDFVPIPFRRALNLRLVAFMANIW
jgi:hypothetical protein